MSETLENLAARVEAVERRVADVEDNVADLSDALGRLGSPAVQTPGLEASATLALSRCARCARPLPVEHAWRFCPWCGFWLSPDSRAWAAPTTYETTTGVGPSSPPASLVLAARRELEDLDAQAPGPKDVRRRRVLRKWLDHAIAVVHAAQLPVRAHPLRLCWLGELSAWNDSRAYGHKRQPHPGTWREYQAAHEPTITEGAAHGQQ